MYPEPVTVDLLLPLDAVEIRNVQICREFFCAYLSQSDNICLEAKSQRLRKCSGQLILYSRLKGRDMGRVMWNPLVVG